MIEDSMMSWWNRLWIRKDEFHRSLIMDDVLMSKMNEIERDKYRVDLIRRRNIAHKRDLRRYLKK